MDMFYQMHRASRTTAPAATGRSSDYRTASHVAELERRMDKLTMLCSAMWELLQERTDLTDDDLNERVMQIDLRDGQADGKVQKEVANCPKCGRVMSQRHVRCLYCGADKLDAGSFDSVL